MNLITKRRLNSTASVAALLLGLAAMPTYASTTPSVALPAGGAVVAGSASIGSASGNQVSVTQTSNRAVIDWNSFSVAAGGTVAFNQPGVGSATLNRVTGDAVSTIAGQITATGSVFLVNPNGIQITKDGVVNVGRGFVASTYDIANADFMAGSGAFAGNGGVVLNAGTITTGNGGFVGLLGGSVGMSGTIIAPAGNVTVAAGTLATFDLNGGNFLSVALPATATLNADGSAAAVSVQDAAAAVRNLVNVPASLIASGLTGSDGKVELTGSVNVDSASGNAGNIKVLGQSVTASGSLSAQATGGTGNGGLIETSGNTVDFTGLTVNTSAANGATGTWLVDPIDLTVDAAAAATINAALASTNVTLQTNPTYASGAGTTSVGAGNITIASALGWTSGGSLNITAYNNININANITAPGGYLLLTAGNGVPNTGAITASGAIAVGSFALVNGAWSQLGALPAFSASNFGVNVPFASFLRATGGAGTTANPYLIADVYGLQGVASSTLLASNFALANSINASGTSGWFSGFTPIGTDGAGTILAGVGFTGTFNGAGWVISGLSINRPNITDIGLFGSVGGAASIYNLGVSGGSFVGAGAVGGLIGVANGGTFTNDWSSNNVQGTGGVGGFVGQLVNSTVSNSYATGSATSSTASAGGFVGYAQGSTISNAYATGNVTTTGSSYTGGFVGNNNSANISSSYSTGAVSGNGNYVGGFAGYQQNVVANSYWDSYSSGRANAFGVQSGNSTNVTAVTSDPTQSAAANYAYKASAYANLTAGSGIGTATPTGFVFAPGNLTRPFLAFEVPNAAITPTASGNLVISSSHQLQLIDYNSATLSQNYALGNNIDLSQTGAVTVGTPSSYAGMWSGAGFVSLGTDGGGTPLNGGNGFNSIFNGAGYLLSNLFINQTVRTDGRPANVGLFGVTGTSSQISNLGVINANISSTGIYVGILAGNLGGTLTNSYSTGKVSSTDNAVGGLVGSNTGQIINSYSTAGVSGSSYVGGLVGLNAGTDTNTYAAGAVTGTGSNVGGLVGSNSSTITNSFYSTTTTGKTQGIGGTVDVAGTVMGETTAQMMTPTTFSNAGWSIDSTGGQATVWRIYAGNSAPLLKVFLTPLTVTANSATYTYNRSVQYAYGYTSSINGAVLSGTATNTGGSGANAGSYVHSVSGLYSNQQGYDINYVTGGMTINKLALNGSIAGVSSAYGSAITPGAVSFSNLVAGDSVSGAATVLAANNSANLSSSGHLNVGTYAETFAGLSGSSSGNYSIGTITTSNYVVHQAALTGTIGAGNSVYGASLTPGALTLTGVVSGDVVNGGAVSVATTGNTSSSGHLNAGNYTGIESVGNVLAGKDAANYSFAGATGNYTVAQAALAIAAINQTKVYGSALPALTYTTKGLVSGDALSGALATTGSVASNVGTYAINIGSLSASANYKVSYTGANMAITPATLTYVADQATRLWLWFNPCLTGTVTGFVLKDSLATATIGSLTFSTAANILSAPGSYAITGSGLKAKNGNYVFVQAPGNATALKVVTLVQWYKGDNNDNDDLDNDDK